MTTEGQVKLTFSGRTSLDIIIKDIAETYSYERRVYLPNYICDSVIMPFKRNNYDIQFYNINFNKNKFTIELEDIKDNSVFLGLNYFGYKVNDTEEVYKLLNKKNIVIIDDVTHNLWNHDSNYADYKIASLRKWFPIISGSAVWGLKKEVNLNKPSSVNFINEKMDAMRLKKEFIYKNSEESAEFKRLYSKFNSALNGNYENIGIDDYSFDYINQVQFEYLNKRRKQNVETLLIQLKGIKEVKFPNYSEKSDVPLFLPLIFVDKHLRDKVHQHLIENKIYCPIHWPRPGLKDTSLSQQVLYDQELSLVIDHRYEIMDMKYIANLIKESLENA